MAKGAINFVKAGVEGAKTFGSSYAIKGESTKIGWEKGKPPLTVDGKNYTFGSDVAVDAEGNFDESRPRSRTTVTRLGADGKEEMAIAVESFEDGDAWMFEWDLSAEEVSMGDRLQPGDPRLEEINKFSEVFLAESERLARPDLPQIAQDAGHIALNP